MIFVVDLKILMHTNKLNIFMIIGILIMSIGSFIAYAFIADTIRYFNVYWTLGAIFSSPIFYLNVVQLTTINIIL